MLGLSRENVQKFVKKFKMGYRAALRLKLLEVFWVFGTFKVNARALPVLGVWLIFLKPQGKL
jgi:hypothetical protein